MDKHTVPEPYIGTLFHDLKKPEELSRYKKRKLKCILLSERNQYEEPTYYVISTICHSGKYRDNNSISGC